MPPELVEGEEPLDKSVSSARTLTFVVFFSGAIRVGGSLYMAPPPFFIFRYYSNTTFGGAGAPIRVHLTEFMAKNHPDRPGSLSRLGVNSLLDLI